LKIYNDEFGRIISEEVGVEMGGCTYDFIRC